MIRSYRVISSALANGIVSRDHYATKMPNFIKLVYADVLSESGSKVLACAIFSLPIGRSDLEALELTRLVRLPDYDRPLTKLISKAVGHIRNQRLADLLISYADSEEDHHGGIYQSCSWIYAGMRGERLDGFNIDGLFVPARTCNGRYGTSSAEELPKLLPKSKVEPHFDKGKHLYWKALTKAGMQKAVSYGFESLPYPKPLLTAPNAVGSPPERPITKKGVVPLPSLESPTRNPTRFTGLSGGIPIRIRYPNEKG